MALTSKAVGDYLRNNPKSRPTLAAALEHEDGHRSEATYYGWEWFDVRAYPASLMKLVVDGLISVTLKTNSTTAYRLSDIDAVRAALAEPASYNVPAPL